MRKIVLVLVAALALGACSKTLQDAKNTFDILTSTKISPTSVILAANAFDALEVSATNYLRLTKCSALNGPVCRNPEASRAIIKAIRVGRPIRNKLITFLRDHPGELGPQGLYDALNNTAQTIQAIFVQYNVGVAP